MWYVTYIASKSNKDTLMEVLQVTQGLPLPCSPRFDHITIIMIVNNIKISMLSKITFHLYKNLTESGISLTKNSSGI